jgi:hypothetical protein
VPAKVYPLGEWQPDKAPSQTNTLSDARNVKPIANGYGPMPGFSGITPTLGAAFNGGGAFVGSDGNSTFLAATSAELMKYSGAAWTNIVALTSTKRLRLAQFGDNVLHADGGTIGAYNLISGATSTPTDAPTAIDIAQARDFTMAITTDNALQWCQFNNTAVWTLGVNQADKQPSLWGSLRAIVGGEYVIAFTERAVVRGTYIGAENDIIWRFDEISAEIGCMAQGSVCSVGKMIGFLSERGFQITDGATIKPIGDEKFNRWFFNAYSRDQIATMWSAIDPRNSLMLWGVPGGPGKIIAYNWVLDRASILELPFTGLFTGFTANTSLESLDALYPSGLDSIPISLDDPSLAGGSPLLLIADASNAIGTLYGSAMQATFRLPNIEPVPARRARIRSVRPVTDATDVGVTIDARMKTGDAENVVSCSSMRSNGKMPVRANGRYNTVQMTIPAGATWTYAQGIECEFEAGDGR